jgi:N-acetylneuraminic acid mutarotase
MKSVISTNASGAALALLLFSVPSAHATVSTVAWWTLGDNDPGAANGGTARTTTTDLTGVHPLSRLGTPHYTSDVAALASDQLDSSLAVQFSGSAQCYTNAIVATARNNFGLEAWIQPPAASAGNYVIAYNGLAAGNSGNAANGWGIYLNVDSFGVKTVRGLFGGVTNVGSASVIVGRWTHIALVRDNGTATLYINGTAAGSTTTAAPATPTGAFTLAASTQLPAIGSTAFLTNFWPGSIDEVRVFTFTAGQFTPDDLLYNQSRAQTLLAASAGPGSATLNGISSTFGLSTTVWFEWGASTNSGTALTSQQPLGSSYGTSNYSQTITGLGSGVYFCRAIATNDFGLVQGNWLVFGPPSVQTLPATGVIPPTATLNGQVIPNNSDTAAWFNWGTTTNYGNQTTRQSAGNGTLGVSVNQALSDLDGNITYHFQIVASNQFGVSLGADQTFTSVVSPSFTSASRLNTARANPLATLLSNGKVLVAAGFNDIFTNYLASAELYDPANGTWTNTGSLHIGRDSSTMIALPNGKVLMVGGAQLPSDASASVETYDPATGIWTTSAPLATARLLHTATLLPNGKVLVVGGIARTNTMNIGPLTSAEIFDPASGTWSNTGALPGGRFQHTATLLPNGKVLVAGGYANTNASTVLSDAEIYDPGSGTWATINPMQTPRAIHTATLLPNGTVLVAGGVNNNSSIPNAEVYDPMAGTWTPIQGLNTARRLHTASLLPNGKVLVVGGRDNTLAEVASAELYDPASGSWTAVATLTTARFSHDAVLLASGELLVVGGYSYSSGYATNAEVYGYANGSWANTSSLASARYEHTATLLPNGLVLAAGGIGNVDYLAASELYNSATGTWAATGAMGTKRVDHSATLLPNGKVLVAGGFGSNVLASAELYDSATGSWTFTGHLNDARERHTATLLTNGLVLVVGGMGTSNIAPPTSAELYDPTTGLWTMTGSIATNRVGHTATLLPNGKVLVAGGSTGLFYLLSGELYDPATGTWSLSAPMINYHYGHTASLLPSGKVLVSGGAPYGNTCEVYDPASNTWTNTGSLNASRQTHTSTLLPNGKVLVAGGFYSTNVLAGAEIYDPASGTWSYTWSLNFAREVHTATLLPNGKVLVAGGGDVSALTNAELYDVGLGFSNSWQVQISSATSPLPLAANLQLNGSNFRGISEASGGNGSQDSSSDYPLVQLRSLANDQVLFLSPTNWSTNSFASTPIANFPKGYALATPIVNGIPGTAAIILYAASLAPTPIVLTSLTKLPGGAFSFSFTNYPGYSFTALASTNVSLPLSNWTVLGSISEVSTGRFQFTDLQATNNSKRFYRARWP